MDIFDLDEWEAQALYWRCKGSSPDAVAYKLNMAVSKFYEYQKSALEKLEIPGKPKEKYGNFVRKGGCELLLKISETDIQNWYEKREELRKELLKPSAKPVSVSSKPSPDSSELSKTEPKPRKISPIPFIILATLGVGILMGYLFFNSGIPEPNSTNSPVTLGATTPSLASQAQEFTPVPASETAIILTNTPSLTPTITNTPPPTNTFTPSPEPIFSEGDTIKDNRVSLMMKSQEFNAVVATINRRDFLIGYKFVFKNISGGDLFLQITTGHLSAVDSLGRSFDCRLFVYPNYLDELSKPLEPNQSTQFEVYCGQNSEITPDTEWVKLKISEFTSLPEMTWTSPIQR